MAGSLEAIRADVRVSSIPLAAGDPVAEPFELLALLCEVDAVGVCSRAEAGQVRRRLAGTRLSGRSGRSCAPDVVELDVAYPVNRSSADSQLVGMSDFGRYVVVLTGFPPGTTGAARAPGHDYVRRALGPVVVAEVGHDRWLISDRQRIVEVPVRPSRPNLWRLLRHAEVCLDLRPQGVIGRETLESLRLGTPVVVPEGTVAAEHAERSNGGLWYRDYRELFDAGRVVLDNAALRAALGEQGRTWAEQVHGDHGAFSEQVARLVLG